MRTKRRWHFALMLVLIAGLAIIPLVSISSGAPLQQIDPTSQHQTIDAVVQQRIQQTVQAQQDLDLTRTAEAASSRTLIAATAEFEATVNAQIYVAQTATQAAGIQATEQATLSTIVLQEFDGVPMVQVPAGCFMMGSNQDSDEQPVHEQCFDTPFWIDQTEVTQAQFAQFGGEGATSSFYKGEQRPAERITWFEARDFCELRGARLPTEAEWEYAARGPGGFVYPWGNEWDESRAIWNRSRDNGTADVGSVPEGASWVGALDMSGNVREWVSSLYEPYPFDATDGREANGDTSTAVSRVQRGGSWSDNRASLLRAAARVGESVRWAPGSHNGFRCANSLATP